MTFENNRPKENVHSYPRPPALQSSPLRLQVIWKDAAGAETVIADTTSGYRVLETTHPPTYYIPPSDVNVSLLKKNSKGSFCEWKGSATYYDFNAPAPSTAIVRSRIWSYNSPTKGFAPIAGYFAMYAGAGLRGEEGWKCLVEGEEVVAQEGDFYGGWKTSEIEGKTKGGPGTWGW